MRLPNFNPLESPRSSAIAGTNEVVKENFDFVNGANKSSWSDDPMIVSQQYLDANKQENTIKITAATAPVDSGLTKDEAKGQTVEALAATYKPMPTMDQAETQDAYGMINTPTPVMQDTTIDQWNPAYRNFAIGSAIGNLFNGRGLDGAIQQFGAFADTQQGQAQLAYQKQVAEAAQRRQTGLDKLKIIQDIYGTDRQVVNDFNDNVTRQIGILQTAENRRLDNEAKMDRLMYQSESKIDEITLKGQFDLAKGKMSEEGKLRSDLIKVASTGDRSMYPQIAKMLNKMIPGLNLSEGERPYTQRELDYISKIAYRTAITDPTVRNLEARTGLVGAQTEQAIARTRVLEEEFKWYGKKAASEIAKRYADIENIDTDNALNREIFEQKKNDISKLMNGTMSAQRDAVSQAQREVQGLRDRLTKYQSDLAKVANPTQAELDTLQGIKNSLQAAKNKYTEQYAILEAIVKKNVEVMGAIDEKYKGFGIETPAENDGTLQPARPDISGIIGGGVARNRP